MIGVLRNRPHRGVPLVLGLHALYAALILLLEEQAGEARYTGNMPYGVGYAIAGCACLWYSLRPTEERAWRYSMALLFGSYLARSLLILWDGLAWGMEYRHLLGVGTWAGWGLVVLQIWRHYLTPERR